MIWQPHHRKPEAGQTAIIAIKPPKDDPDDVSSILLAELYRYDPHWGCWLTEVSGLKLNATEFWWLPERELLATLP